MIREALGAAVLGGSLLGAPYAPTAAAAPGAAEAAVRQSDDLFVRIRVKPGTGAQGRTSVRIQVRDSEKNPVQVRMCLQARTGRQWANVLPEPPFQPCGTTDDQGSVKATITVPARTYRIHIEKQGGFDAYTSESFEGDETEDTGWQKSAD
ncbi:hypothetical protein [Actinocorallia populi]|uniref:hypothetical protein n=1 Tax=Actinocorallia populi TaxID=2079200 RepID=UPI000D097797|nr:hypothetical protein [Actinocorallia populi]